MRNIFKINSAVIVATALFAGLFLLGIFLSAHKPLWSDEILTAKHTIPDASYFTIAQGNISGEANNFPLYYVIQKTVMSASHYTLKPEWQGEHFLFDKKGQIILRIPSNFFIALALSLMVFFFIKRKDTFSAIVSFLLTISSYITWAYWPEARPYALWFGLSIIHGLLLFDIFEEKKINTFSMLIITHWLLALTSVVSFAQIALANILIFTFINRDFKKLILLSTPLPIIFFYLSTGMSVTPQIDITGPASLLSVVAPFEWLTVILIGIIFLAFHKNLITKQILLFTTFFFGMLFLAMGIILIAVNRHNTSPFEPVLYYRHLIFLTPYTIFLTTHILKQLWDYYQHRPWARINVGLFILGLIITTGLRSINLLFENIIFIF